MKKIIFLTILLISSIAYAEDNIPGFLELDLSYEKYDGKYGRDNPKLYIAGTNIKIKYGATFVWFNPYAIVEWETFFKYDSSNYFSNNKPFQDIYTYGAGFFIKELFYFEYKHSCSHAVIFDYDDNGISYKTTRNDYNFEGLFTDSYDSFKVGIKVRID